MLEEEIDAGGDASGRVGAQVQGVDDLEVYGWQGAEAAGGAWQEAAHAGGAAAGDWISRWLVAMPMSSCVRAVFGCAVVYVCAHCGCTCARQRLRVVSKGPLHCSQQQWSSTSWCADRPHWVAPNALS